MLLERYFSLVVSLLLFILFTPTNLVSAACGNIVYQTDYGDGLVEETEPIADCDNPFGTAGPTLFEVTLSLNNQSVINNTVVSLIENETINGTFNIDADPDIDNEVNVSSEPFQLFHHEGEDYIQVFKTDSKIFEITSLEEGNYVALFSYEEPSLQVNSDSTWKKWMKKIFLPNIAHALAPAPVFLEVIAISFTVEVEPIAPLGASSVLFLPGIMGSRLYEEGSECGDEFSEQERWFSFDECDQLRLKTNFIGDSINNIYTKDGRSSIVEKASIISLYKTFLDKLEEWEGDGVISDFVALPYDWRLSLGDAIGSKRSSLTGVVAHDASVELNESYLYETVAALANSSKSGKVTVVTHSNGGLLAKHFLSELERHNDPLLQKIDNLIMVGVPQTGTPESLVSILHGTEINHVMSHETTRQIVNTMPFAHHLLPTEEYFSSVSTPVIEFESGEVTDSLIAKFGAEVTDVDSLHNFLGKDSGRVKPSDDDLSAPQIVDGFLLDYAKTEGVIQSNWSPSEEVKVYQIAGTGLETPSQIVYFTDSECVSRFLFKCTEHESKLGYRIVKTIDGDGTVVTPSALAMSDVDDSVERWWLNLRAHNDDESDREHKNLFEINEITTFINDVLNREENLFYGYISNSEPSVGEGNRLVFQLHSPLDMHLSTASGGVLSSTTNTINGSEYSRYGELQYISVPSSQDITLFLDGVSDGSFTLDIDEMDGESLQARQTYSAIPSSASSKVVLQVNNEQPISELELEVDYEGDGTVDVVYGEESEEESEVTYNELYQAVRNLDLDKRKTHLLLKKAKKAQKFSEKKKRKKHFNKKERKKLQKLVNRLNRYEKKHLISVQEKDSIEEIIDELLCKK